MKSAARVVEFHADDLPAPGDGFNEFFAHIEGDLDMSRQAFDEEVMVHYKRDEPGADQHSPAP